MPIDIKDLGEGNTIDLSEADDANIGGTIVFKGSRSRVVLERPFIAHAVQIEMGDDCMLHVGSGCYAGVLGVHMTGRGTAIVGSGSSFNGQTRLLLHEPGRIEIGSGCLFGPDVDVTVSDMHAIVDLTTGQRVNPARDVQIGERVWIGIGTFIGKGARIGRGAVVGARTFVSGEVRPNTVVAGNPARLVRENASWTFTL